MTTNQKIGVRISLLIQIFFVHLLFHTNIFLVIKSRYLIVAAFFVYLEKLKTMKDMKERNCNDVLKIESILITDKGYGKMPYAYANLYNDILEPIKVIEKPKSKYHK